MRANYRMASFEINIQLNFLQFSFLALAVAIQKYPTERDVKRTTIKINKYFKY